MTRREHIAALPRFMSDCELRAHFGLSERALNRLRATRTFPARDALINKTDRRSVEFFFDRRAGLASTVSIGSNHAVVDGEENFDA